ncbi:allatostatin double C isoform X1 [Leptinotarsa decemlineata]|uniref:allatostatin double C isoform X1 n=1 Tax=Leptinotarsa decemlineata TaxID=7539 RepID=UPI003D30D3B6
MTSVFLIVVLFFFVESLPVDQKVEIGFGSLDENPDYQLGVTYDEYPLIVPKKRTAMLVNKLMVALKEAMEEDVREETFRNPNRLDGFSSRSSKHYLMSDDDVRSMDLQRRGHGGMGQQKGKNYWRCYFNAVTCF